MSQHLRNPNVEEDFSKGTIALVLIVLRCHWLHCARVETILPRSVGWPVHSQAQECIATFGHECDPNCFALQPRTRHPPSSIALDTLTETHRASLCVSGLAAHCTGIKNQRDPVLIHAFQVQITYILICPWLWFESSSLVRGPPGNLTWGNLRLDSWLCQPAHDQVWSVTCSSQHTYY